MSNNYLYQAAMYVFATRWYRLPNVETFKKWTVWFNSDFVYFPIVLYLCVLHNL